MHASETFETYVIRTVRVDAIDDDLVDTGPRAEPGRDERKAALRFDAPLAAAEMLLAPPDRHGRYRPVAGACLQAARESGRSVVLAAVARSTEAARHVLPRWQVHHAA